MSRRYQMLLCLFMAHCAFPVQAYEVQTHAELSASAFLNSTWASDTTGPEALGLAGFPYGSFPSSEAGQLIPRELVALGAEREDDDTRPINHFYDPYQERTLPVPFSTSSPDWSLEGSMGGVQQFAYRYALGYFGYAMSADVKDVRARNWAKLFESLGHIVHHIQDMAQPQHVRADAHYHRDWPLVGDPSLLEFCTDAAVESTADEGCGRPLQSPPYTAVVLPHARDYWTTRSRDPYGRRRGIADFTNANFVSKDTNFELRAGAIVVDAHYNLPVPTTSRTFTLEELGEPETCERLRRDPRVFGDAARCEIEFYATDIYDAYTATSSVNERASSLSMFDQYLELRADGRSYRTDRLFTLNRFNYAAAQPFLISRAIGYSAGLIDHFFRGRLEFGTAEVDGDVVQVEIKNISGENNAFGPGTFEAYYDSASGTRKPLPLESGRELGMGQFAPDAMHTLRFTVPDDVDLKSEKPFVLVYTGIVGAEEAVTGLVFDAPLAYEGFLFDTDWAGDRVEGPRLIYQQNGQWKLHPQGNLPMRFSVDWKGWYENGIPTRMLTWKGERYEGDNNPWPTIYERGRVLAVAPCGVRGAALQKDAEGQAWVVAICDVGDSDVVLRRPATSNTSPAFYDPQHPDGWQKLGEFPNPAGLGNGRSAWLFNGDGTEAQTMRERERPHAEQPMPLARLKIFVDAATARFENLGNTVVTRRSIDEITWDCTYSQPGSMSIVHDEVINGEHIVAVDYVDRREILARLRVESASNTANRGQAYASSSDVMFDGTETWTEDAVWTLEFGGVSVDLFDGERADSREYVNGSGWRDTYVNRHLANGTLVLFMDLRSDVLVTATRYRETGSRTDVDDRTFTRNEFLKTHFVHRTHLPSGSLPELQTDVVDSDTVYPEAQVPGNWYYPTRGLAENCYQDTESWDALTRTQSEEEFTATLDTAPFPAMPGTLANDLVAAAIDRKGNFFMGRWIYDGIAERSHFANYLTGGDIDAIIGFDPAGLGLQFDAPFSPIVPN